MKTKKDNIIQKNKEYNKIKHKKYRKTTNHKIEIKIKYKLKYKLIQLNHNKIFKNLY